MRFVSPHLREAEIAICILLFAAIVFLDWRHKVSRSVVDRFTRALAFSAIAFAIFQFYDSGKLIDRLEEQAGRFEVVEKEMSTRSARNFPKNMKDINEVVARTTKELDIITDYAGYGHYSAPGEFDTYFATIEKLRDKAPAVKVRMIIYTREQAQ